MTFAAFLLLGYLIGSVSFAVLVSRAFRLADPRTFGSGNPGATNVLRSGNKLAALLTLLGDAFKGWLAMQVARWLGADGTAVAGAGVAAFVGHIYPVFHRFRGGKGVATALGVLAGFSAPLALVCGGVWAAAALLFRYSSLAAICAAVAAPFAAAALIDMRAVMGVSAMSALLIFRHRENIRRLLSGTESRIGAKKQKAGT
ncbi:MAG TPA: glycerol-3-phosphate 1-O-acyltransferase PlsY [Rhodocyclaceae bacterium]|nr:glycerol-3-phosphate 1-O-acyltransferase PlsY [Rhodocyclaceae bacterium]HNH36088.1 glycerol-3-phosphate 1-O-acyltransferase PlsY [Rhodocyclaceae bacterium]